MAPRTLEEFHQQVQKLGKEKGLQFITAAEKNNEEIRKSRAILEMMKSEGWGYFWERINGYEETINISALASITGDILKKGAAVERIQGKLELMGVIDAEVEFHKKNAAKEPLDVDLFKDKLNQFL